MRMRTIFCRQNCLLVCAAAVLVIGLYLLVILHYRDDGHLDSLPYHRDIVNMASHHKQFNTKPSTVPASFRFPTYNNTDLTNPYRGPSNDRQQAVVGAFMHAWRGYKKYAWGHDELKPVSKGWIDWLGSGLTIVDSLDTMYIMGLHKEIRLARHWVSQNLTFGRNAHVSAFETVIRYLGGLLSIYHFTGDKLYLDKALELGELLMPCFHGQTAIPCNQIHMQLGQAQFLETSTAECGSLQLEMRDLSRVSGVQKFEEVGFAVSEHLHKLRKFDGLVPNFISPLSGGFRESVISLGGGGDSYYEYLLKQWIQTGKVHDWLRDDYLAAVEGIKKHLLQYTYPNSFAFVGSLTSQQSKTFKAEMEHLTCFLPGTLALGVMHGLDPGHLALAVNLTRTCYEMYRSTPTGLSPDSVLMNVSPQDNKDIHVQFNIMFNLQRPETIESLFYLYRATGDDMYREWGWQIFNSFENMTKVETGGYAALENVLSPESPVRRDKMESFFLAETLKYFYLLFSDDPRLLPLNEVVFNTEAHPLPIFGR